jgi:hypothetical protein
LGGAIRAHKWEEVRRGRIKLDKEGERLFSPHTKPLITRHIAKQSPMALAIVNF